MQAPFQETSPTLIIDLTNKFLSKLLGNDPNSSLYLKQWSSFRELLSAAPFDLNPIFSFIGTLTSQPCQSGEHSATNKLYLPSGLSSPTKDRSCGDPADSPLRIQSKEPSVEATRTPGHKRVISNNFSFPHITAAGMHMKKAASINRMLPSSFKPSIDNLDSAGNQRINTPASIGNVREGGSLAGIDSASTPGLMYNLQEEEQAGLNYLRSEGHSLTFLAEMARKMKNKFRRHNENLVQRHVVIKERTPSPEFRTPLRTVKVYNTNAIPIDSMNIYGSVKTQSNAETRAETPNLEDESSRRLIYNVQKLPLY